MLRGQLLILFLTAVLKFHLTQSMRFEAKLLEDTRSVVLLSRPFGFAPSGNAVLHLLNDTIESRSDSQAMLIKMAIAMVPSRVTRELENGVMSLSEQPCDILNDHRVQVILSWPLDPSQRLQDGSIYRVWDAPERGVEEYSVFFLNCALQVKVSINLQIILTNLVDGQIDHLAAGDAILPSLSWLFFILYLFATLAWYILVVRRRNAEKMQIIVAALFGLKTLSLLTQALRYDQIRITGLSDTFDAVHITLQVLRGIMVFGVTILVAIGWLSLQPHLPTLEKIIISVLIPVQLIAYSVKTIIDGESSFDRGFMTWRIILHGLDLICFCAILLPVHQYLNRRPPIGNIDIEHNEECIVIGSSLFWIPRMVCKVINNT
ncbi:hypothetical protein CYMTET_56567 [Cymbomonas tetramitiformis]|uniref:Intimal thickness related receptor IRP domain-containing protein n=1 Tax=Cymbomonas tetramitiformis TaxID=36881 RepID=A0AAE0BB17_9CHLO|nr:hypothetical protein CYMTET_56567 [Cymbomonas tetramitiformis]|eukprot:gene21625-26012_t